MLVVVLSDSQSDSIAQPAAAVPAAAGSTAGGVSSGAAAAAAAAPLSVVVYCKWAPPSPLQDAVKVSTQKSRTPRTPGTWLKGPAHLAGCRTLPCTQSFVPLHPLAPALPPPLAAPQVVARGSPRPWARAKHCEWVLQRRALEAFRPADAAEVILLDGDGGLLEGLVSNFFVVAGERSAALVGLGPAKAE
jgi:hypothetical protein